MQKFAFAVEVRNPVFDKTDGTCTYCAGTLDRNKYGDCGKDPSADRWEVDHWVPVATGGDGDQDNLWPACCKCNDNKKTMTGEEYIAGRERAHEPTNGRLLVAAHRFLRLALKG